MVPRQVYDDEESAMREQLNFHERPLVCRIGALGFAMVGRKLFVRVIERRCMP